MPTWILREWSVRVVRRINKWAHGGWDANGMTWKQYAQLTEWINEPMNRWSNEATHEGITESANQWVSETMKQWINEFKNLESMKQRINESINEHMNGLVDGWMKGWMDGWVSDIKQHRCNIGVFSVQGMGWYGMNSWDFWGKNPTKKSGFERWNIKPWSSAGTSGRIHWQLPNGIDLLALFVRKH